MPVAIFVFLITLLVGIPVFIALALSSPVAKTPTSMTTIAASSAL